MFKVPRVLVFSLLAISAITLSFVAGLGVASWIRPPREFDIVEEAWNILSEDFIDKEALDPKKLSEGAIKGMLDALADPYTSYIDAELYELEQSTFKGKFEGIGAVITIEDGQLTVIAPIVGSPAEEAGIGAEDIILEVNGEPTSEMSLAEAVLKVRGEAGTKVRLTILHPGETTTVEIEIVREEINVDSVYLEMLPNNIAYIQVTYFSERTGSELTSLLNEIRSLGASGIILDLRDNPGGLLQAAVAVASQFLEQGVVLYEVDNQGVQYAWPVLPGGLVPDLPLVVLVNEASASGSEVVAGALQDQERAPLIGTKTFGKGSVNIFSQMSDGSALYVTFARWLTPNGHLIEGQGLSPDFWVEPTEEDMVQGNDPQLEQAISYIESKIALELPPSL